MFSQIPGNVLKKAKLPYPKFIPPAGLGDRPDILESTTRLVEISSSSDDESSNGEDAFIKTAVASVAEVTTSTTPTKTTSTTALMVDGQSQTTLTMAKIASLEADVKHLEAVIEGLKAEIGRLEVIEESLQDGCRPFQPTFALRCGNGRNPPLKIGLTLPKGIKRKVFYPSDEEN